MSYSLFIEIVIYALVSYRVSNVLASPYEEAPYELAKRHRLFWGKFAANRRNKPFGYTAHTIAQLFNCPHCMGVWVALVIALIAHWGEWSIMVVVWFAVAGLQSFMYLITNR